MPNYSIRGLADLEFSPPPPVRVCLECKKKKSRCTGLCVKVTKAEKEYREAMKEKK